MVSMKGLKSFMELIGIKSTQNKYAEIGYMNIPPNLKRQTPRINTKQEERRGGISRIDFNKIDKNRRQNTTHNT